MRCEKWAEFGDGTEEEDRCKSDATVRLDASPTETNKVGQPGSLFFCRDCADNCEDSESWTYELTIMETGETYERRGVEYEGIRVESKLPRSVLQASVLSDQFRTAADEAIACVARWGVSVTKLTVCGVGVHACTRSGDRVLVRF